MTVAPTFSTAPSNGNPDGPAVLHPVPDGTPPTWLSALLRWAPVGLGVVASLWWLEVLWLISLMLLFANLAARQIYPQLVK